MLQGQAISFGRSLVPKKATFQIRLICVDVRGRPRLQGARFGSRQRRSQRRRDALRDLRFDLEHVVVLTHCTFFSNLANLFRRRRHLQFGHVDGDPLHLCRKLPPPAEGSSPSRITATVSPRCGIVRSRETPPPPAVVPLLVAAVTMAKGTRQTRSGGVDREPQQWLSAVLSGQFSAPALRHIAAAGH